MNQGAVPLRSLPEYVQLHARSNPRREAAVDERRRLTYADLSAEMRTGSQWLNSVGIEGGDRVAFLGSPGTEFLTSLLSAIDSHVVWLGLNPSYRAGEFHAILQDAQPRLVTIGSSVGQPVRKELYDAVDALNIRPILVSAREMISPGAKRTPADRTVEILPPDTAVIVYTSGTTGRPKGAMIPNSAVVHAALAYLQRYANGAQRILNNLPINHVGCIVDLLAPALVGGWTTIFRSKFDPIQTMDTLADERITFWGQVPAMFELVARCGSLPDASRRQLQYVLWGGAPISHRLLDWLAELEVDLSTNYGMTESVGSVTMTEVGASRATLEATVGRPVEPLNFRIVDDAQHQITAAGREGEIQVRGHVFHGYFRSPTATTEAFTSEGWLHTGDNGALTSDGYVQLTGRRKEMFKSGGYNVYPREVEAALEAYPGITLAAVVPVLDDLWGESGTAFFVSSDAINEEDLRAFLRERLASYKIPKRFLPRSSLPLLPVGKVDRSALRRDASGNR